MIEELVPKVLTKRFTISVGSNDDPSEYVTDIDILLRDRNNYSWFRAGDYKDYIKVYIVEFRNSNDFAELFQNRIYNPSTRVEQIKNLITSTDEYSLNPQDNLDALISVEDCLGMMYQYVENVTFQVKTLSEITAHFAERIAGTPISDLNPSDSSSTIVPTATEYIYTLKYDRHEYQAEMSDLTRRSLARTKQPQDLSYVVFCHIDITELLSQNNIDPTWAANEVEELNSIGGTSIFDKILINGSSPLTKKVYTLIENPGVVYTGPVHYRSEMSAFGIYEIGNGNTFEGYMTGVEPSSESRMLSEKTIRNNKVKFLEEVEPCSEFSSCGPSAVYSDQPHKNTYPVISMGANRDAGMEPYSFTSFQSSLDFLSRERLEIKHVEMKHLFETMLLETRSRNSVDGFMEVSKDLLGNGHIVFSFDYISLIRNHSSLGYLLDSFTGNDGGLEFIKHSKILDLSLWRKRVTDDLYGIGPLGAKDRRTFDENEPWTLVARSHDDDNNQQYRGNLQYCSNVSDYKNDQDEYDVLGTIEEFDLVVSEEPEPGRFRSFEVYDYTLPKMNDGTYTYIMDISVKDGFNSVLNEFYEDYKNNLRGFKEFLMYAGIPHDDDRLNNYKELGINPDSRPSPGAYNHRLKRYTQPFIEFYRDSGLHAKVQAAIISYAEILRLIGFSKKVQESSPNRGDNIINSLMNFRKSIEENVHPTADGTLENAEKFYQNMLDMLSILKKMLDKPSRTGSQTSTEISSSLDFNTPTGNVASSEVPEIINIKKDYKRILRASRLPIQVSYIDTTTSYQDILLKWSLDSEFIRTVANIPVPINNFLILPQAFYSNYTPLWSDETQRSLNMSSYIPQVLVNWSPPRITYAGQQANYGQIDYIRSQANSQISRHMLQNKIFNLSDATTLRPMDMFLIKVGLDNCINASNTSSEASAGMPYVLPTGVFDFTKFANITAGLLGFGSAVPYKKFTKKKTSLTHENFNTLLCEAIYFANVGKDIERSMMKSNKELFLCLEKTAFVDYINAHSRASRYLNKTNSANPWNSTNGISKKKKVPDGILNDTEDLRNKYVLENPATLEEKVRITPVGPTPMDRPHRPSQNRSGSTLRLQNNSNSLKKKKLMIVKPTISKEQHLGQIHSSNNIEAVNTMLLVEV